VRFDIGTEFNQVEPATQRWTDVKSSLKTMESLIKLKNRFDMEQNTVLESELKTASELTV